MTRAQKAERRRRIAEAVVECGSPKDVARRFKVARGFVYASCLKHGVVVRRIQRERTIKRHREIATLYAEGHSTQSLLEQFGVDITTIKTACAANRIPFTESLAATRFLPTFVILKRLLSGERESVIAQSIGVTRQRVNQVKQSAIAAGFDIPIMTPTERQAS